MNTVLIMVYVYSPPSPILHNADFNCSWYLDDILNVRLQTLGVTEHSFPIKMAGRMYTCKLYDVSGAVSDFGFM